jgi:hypothetical protein
MMNLQVKSFGCLLLFGLLYFARPAAAGGAVPVATSASVAEFIEIQTTDMSIDFGDLGGAGFVGDLVSSDEVGIEVFANVPIGISYVSAVGLNNGHDIIPAWLQPSVEGRGQLGEVGFISPGIFTQFGALPAYQLGTPAATVLFDPYALTSTTVQDSVRKGLRFRMLAERKGLQDSGGHYSAEILVTCGRM